MRRKSNAEGKEKRDGSQEEKKDPEGGKGIFTFEEQVAEDGYGGREPRDGLCLPG